MMKSSLNGMDPVDATAGPVASEAGRSPSTLSTGRAGPLAPGQRWSVARKREVVLRLLRGEFAEFLSRELGLPTYKLEGVVQNLPLSGDTGVRRPRPVRAGLRLEGCPVREAASPPDQARWG